MIFEFPDDTAPERELWVFARVLKDCGDASERTTVSEAEVVEFEPDVELAFEAVPNGSDYVVSVELKGGRERAERTLYFGESERFALRAGERTEVRVALELASTPSAAGDEDSAVTVDGAVEDGQRLLVRDEVITLLLRPERASRVVVANDAAFSLGLRTIELAELDRDSAADAYRLPDWNLNDGLTCGRDSEAAGLGDRSLRRRTASRIGALRQRTGLRVARVQHPDHRARPARAGARRRTGHTQSGGRRVRGLVRVETTEALGEPPVLRVAPEDGASAPASRLSRAAAATCFGMPSTRPRAKTWPTASSSTWSIAPATRPAPEIDAPAAHRCTPSLDGAPS